MTTPRLIAAASASAVLLIMASTANTFSDPDSAMIRVFLGPQVTSGVLMVLAGAGLATSVFGLLRTGPGLRRILTAVALLEVVGLGVALQSVSTIALAGYLLAMALPFGLLVIAVQAVRRYRRLRWVAIGSVMVVIAAGVGSGLLRADRIAGLARELAGGFADHATQLAVVIALALATVAWVGVLAGSARHSRTVATLGDWVRRHRTGITLIAAAGPLPYVLIRATWLTPWPLLVPAGEAIDPEIRLWGLLLGGAALLGSVLTVGLLRPWGSTFPRWVPRYAGRPVPVRAAAIPAGLVAGIICAAAAPMLRGILAAAPGTVFGGLPLGERLLATLIFPFHLWGPALALATWGYVRFRATHAPSTGVASTPELVTAGE